MTPPLRLVAHGRPRRASGAEVHAYACDLKAVPPPRKRRIRLTWERGALLAMGLGGAVVGLSRGWPPAASLIAGAVLLVGAWASYKLCELVTDETRARR